MSIFEDFDSSYGNGYYTGMNSPTGGADILHDGTVAEHVSHIKHGLATGFDQNGDFVIKTLNQDGGMDEFKHGHHVKHTQHNVFGGTDVYGNDHQLHETSMPNAAGGMDFYDGDMHYKGMSMDNVYSSEDFLSAESNIDDILNYDDPLSHSSEYKMKHFNANQKY